MMAVFIGMFDTRLWNLTEPSFRFNNKSLFLAESRLTALFSG
jgi:hypothetical protein